MKNHIVVARNVETKKWHGHFYVNHPTPSGSPRPVISFSTKHGYDTPDEALEVMKRAFTSEQLENIDVPSLENIH